MAEFRCAMLFRPPRLVELPSPDRCALHFDLNKRAAELMAPQETTKVEASMENSSPWLVPSARTTRSPELLVTNRRICTPVYKSIFPSCKAGRTQQTSASAFASNKQGKPSQVSHRIQRPLARRSTPRGRYPGFNPRVVIRRSRSQM